MKPKIPVEQRFWGKAEIGDSHECWPWQHCRDVEGYGRLKVEGKWLKAHRIAYLLHYGELPDELLICHHCDNPPCINPYHLFAGTQKDNCDDKIRKQRHPFGARHWRALHPEKVARGDGHWGAKITSAQVRDIRSRYAAGGIRQRELAKEYDLPQTQISRIVLRKSWAHVS